MQSVINAVAASVISNIILFCGNIGDIMSYCLYTVNMINYRKYFKFQVKRRLSGLPLCVFYFLYLHDFDQKYLIII